MTFWVWVTIAFCFLIYVTVLFIRSLRTREPFWKNLKRWIVNVIDVLSGGG
jgi:hypothetical protein